MSQIEASPSFFNSKCADLEVYANCADVALVYASSLVKGAANLRDTGLADAGVTDKVQLEH